MTDDTDGLVYWDDFSPARKVKAILGYWAFLCFPGPPRSRILYRFWFWLLPYAGDYGYSERRPQSTPISEPRNRVLD